MMVVIIFLGRPWVDDRQGETLSRLVCLKDLWPASHGLSESRAVTVFDWEICKHLLFLYILWQLCVKLAQNIFQVISNLGQEYCFTLEYLLQGNFDISLIL